MNMVLHPCLCSLKSGWITVHFSLKLIPSTERKPNKNILRIIRSVKDDSQRRTASLIVILVNLQDAHSVYPEDRAVVFWCKTPSDLHFDMKCKCKSPATGTCSAVRLRRASLVYPKNPRIDRWRGKHWEIGEPPLCIERVNKAFQILDVKIQSSLPCNAN